MTGVQTCALPICHSLENRERSLECGIGKCGACEMLVDGKIKRICITPVDNVKTVKEIPHDYLPELEDAKPEPQKVYYTQVAIVGAGFYFAPSIQ